MIDYYEIMEVSPNASLEVIKAAYHILLARYDIDDYTHPKEIEHKVTAVKLAFDVLSDPEKRNEYDRNLNKLKQQSVQKRLEPNKTGRYDTGNDSTVAEDDTSLLARLKWKKWGWSVSILAVAAVLISMVQPDPERAQRGQLAAKREAGRDQAKLTTGIIKQTVGQQSPEPVNNAIKAGEAIKASSVPTAGSDPSP